MCKDRGRVSDRYDCIVLIYVWSQSKCLPDEINATTEEKNKVGMEKLLAFHIDSERKRDNARQRL